MVQKTLIKLSKEQKDFQDYLNTCIRLDVKEVKIDKTNLFCDVCGERKYVTYIPYYKVLGKMYVNSMLNFLVCDNCINKYGYKIIYKLKEINKK